MTNTTPELPKLDKILRYRNTPMSDEMFNAKLTRLVAEKLEENTAKLSYLQSVVDNVSMLANAGIPGEWVDPATGKKLYNQAWIAEKQIELLERLYRKSEVIGVGYAIVREEHITQELTALRQKGQDEK